MSIDASTLLQQLTDLILAPGFRRATFGGPRRGAAPYAWSRIVIRPVLIREERCIQFSFFEARKNITQNLPPRDVEPMLREITAAGFSAIHVATTTEHIDIRTTKKGRVLLGRRPLPTPAAAPDLEHNRVKDLPLPEGKANRLLETMGILTRSGVVRPTMRAKYNQINELLKQLSHVLDDAGVRDAGLRERTTPLSPAAGERGRGEGVLHILDCGCGSSYLTLATHHYLNDILGIPAHIVGVDVNEELIRKSIDRSARLGANVTFTCSPIGAAEARADIVLALHACDTATDDAIARAIAAQARVLLSVPCCHHHLNEQLRAAGPAQVLRPILRHGILQQRSADLVTDAFRALALRIMGYKTDVVEFISSEHTARNLMIRAVRLPDVAGALREPEMFVKEYNDMKQFWQVTPYIEAALGPAFQQKLSL